jgi:hypothetical protein
MQTGQLCVLHAETRDPSAQSMQGFIGTNKPHPYAWCAGSISMLQTEQLCAFAHRNPSISCQHKELHEGRTKESKPNLPAAACRAVAAALLVGAVAAVAAPWSTWAAVVIRLDAGVAIPAWEHRYQQLRCARLTVSK